MDPVTASALIGGAASLAGAGINYLNTKHTNEQQYQYNKNLAEMAYNRNVVQWQRENAYNSPSAQMSRMVAAGLNPNMSFGKGVDVSAGQAGTSPQLQYGEYHPQTPVFDTQSALRFAADMSLLRAQRDNLNSQTALNEGKTATEVAKQQDLYASVQERIARVENTNLDSRSKEIYIAFQEDLYQAQIDKDRAAAALSSEQKRQVAYLVDNIMPKELVLKDKEIQNYEKQWEKLEAEIDALVAKKNLDEDQSAMLKEDLRCYALNHMQRGIMGSGVSVPNMTRTIDEIEKRFYQTKLGQWLSKHGL